MRQFLLQNEYGEQIQLQGKNVFLYAPDGLGFAEDVMFMQTGGFFIPTSEAQAQVEKTGTIVYFGNAYKEYQNLMNWILAAQKLTLAYKPLDTWYYQNVIVKQVEKSELSVGGKVLETPVVFAPTSPIYTPFEQEIKISGSENDGGYKKYSHNIAGGRKAYKYAIDRALVDDYVSQDTAVHFLCDTSTELFDGATDTIIYIKNKPSQFMYADDGGYAVYDGDWFVYGNDLVWHSMDTPDSKDYFYVYSNTAVAGQIKFTVAAQVDCDFDLTIYGAIASPSVTVKREDTHETIGVIDLTATSAQAGEKIKYSTVAGRAGAWLIDTANHSTDLTPYLGLSTDHPTYFRLPANAQCSLQLSAASLEGLKANIKIFRYYRTV